MNVTEILSQLVAFPSVVGQPNREIVAWIADFAKRYGAEVTVLDGPEGDRANMLITLGPREVPGYVVSGHMDVVPAAEPGWSSSPFILRRDRDRLYGRGASDMKGFLAAALACLPQLANSERTRPLHLAFSYDEEAGCRGVPHLIEKLPDLCAAPLGCIIGEPSGLAPVRAHKGKAAVRITVTGQTGHSSRPDLGKNAIHAMSHILVAATGTAQDLTKAAQDQTFTPSYSTLQVGTISGGQAVNIIPDHCSVDIEARAIGGVIPEGLLLPLKTAAEALKSEGFGVEWQPLSSYPALPSAANEALAEHLAQITGRPVQLAVSYGTEAGLFQGAGYPSVICGPGDISRAHKPDEYITQGELDEAVEMILKLAQTGTT